MSKIQTWVALTLVVSSALLGIQSQASALASALSEARLLNPLTDSAPLHHVRSARIKVLQEIALAEKGWTVFSPTSTQVQIVNGFQYSLNDVQCGVMVPSGAATQPTVRTHWDLATEYVSSNGSTFAKLHARTSTGYEIQILCGKGYEEGFFKRMPTIAEVKVLLKDYFEFDFSLNQE